MRLLLAPFALAALLVSACGDDQNPGEARALYDRVGGANHRAWARAPGYEARKPSSAPHGDSVEIFVNDALRDALSKPGTTTWPVGSLVVKDGYRDSELHYVAVMEKRTDGWFWAEYDADGASVYSGKPRLCIDCHTSGADSIRAFGFPQ